MRSALSLSQRFPESRGVVTARRAEGGESGRDLKEVQDVVAGGVSHQKVAAGGLLSSGLQSVASKCYQLPVFTFEGLGSLNYGAGTGVHLAVCVLKR